VVKHEHNPVRLLDRRVRLHDVEMIGRAADDLPDTEQQRGAERGARECVTGEVRRQQQLYRLGAQGAAERDLLPVNVEVLAERAPAAMPGRTVVAVPWQKRDAAAWADLE